MHKLAPVVAAVAAGILFLGLTRGDAGLIGLGAVGVVLAGATWRARAISSFAKVFLAIYAVEYVVFSIAHGLVHIEIWPEALAQIAPPRSLALTVGVFAVLFYFMSHIPLVRTITRFADPYFSEPRSFAAWIPFRGTVHVPEHRFAVGALVLLVLLNQAQVGILLRITFFQRDWFDAMENKDSARFWSEIIEVFIPWVTVYIIVYLAEFVIQTQLFLRWRRWLTEKFSTDWLDRGTQYRMTVLGTGADNPDQRISEDLKSYLETTYTFTIALVTQVSNLVTYSIVLWAISVNFTIPFTDVPLPGLLLWVALIYAIMGTVLTHVVGWRLIPLNFEKEKVEADFRFGLARIREYNEQIAVLRGEKVEVSGILHRFVAIMTNTMAIVFQRVKVAIVRNIYDYSGSIVPYAVSAPFFFAGKLTLGAMQQTATTFSYVSTAFSFFIDRYTQIAAYKAVLDRLTTFQEAIAAARPADAPRVAAPSDGAAIDIADLSLKLPGGREIVVVPGLRLRAHERVLVSGPSGSGKSTLFRAIADIWPLAEGSITTPPDAALMLLPQRPYLPNGTLRAAVAYPASDDAFSDAAIRAALIAVKLPALAEQLDDEDVWSQRLSGGEQQRLQLARALLAEPSWPLLDEATASLDEPLEAAMYALIAEKLPATTVISIGHRSTLNAMHDRRVVMEPNRGGSFTPLDKLAVAVR